MSIPDISNCVEGGTCCCAIIIVLQIYGTVLLLCSGIVTINKIVAFGMFLVKLK